MKKLIRRMINWAMDDIPLGEKYYPNGAQNTVGSGLSAKASGMSIGASGIDNRSSGIHFTVYPATGGKVIQITTYDVRTDDRRVSLYVIGDKENLGQEIGEIITRESLTR